MRKNYFAIHDNLAEVFLTPVIFRSEGEAKRWFKTVINDKNNDVIYNNPNDYELWCVGEWDEKEGIMIGNLHKIVDGRSLKND